MRDAGDIFFIVVIVVVLFMLGMAVQRGEVDEWCTAHIKDMTHQQWTDCVTGGE